MMVQATNEKLEDSFLDSKGPPVEDSLTCEQVGIWQIWSAKRSEFNPRQHWGDMVSGWRLYRRLATEIFSVAPTLFTIFIFTKLWGGIEAALLIHLSSNLLRIIELGLKNGQVDAFAIYMAISSRLLCVVFVTLLERWTEGSIPAFRGRIIQHYEVFLMRARLRLDLSTAQEYDSQVGITANDTWTAFEAVISFLGQILTCLSQLTLIVHISRSSGGPIFALLCVLKPLMRLFFMQNIWYKTFVVNIDNEPYSRMSSLAVLTGDHFRQDYITGNLGNHILSEYEKARERLGNTCADEWWEQIQRGSPFISEIISAMAGDLPMIYCAINTVVNPTKFSIASIAVLQQSSGTLRNSLENVMYNIKTFQRHQSKLKELYTVSEKKTLFKDGDIAYPSEETNDRGMGFELEKLTFVYPGSKSKSAALKDVSLRIDPGQLIVIVGENGSGKSTIIKLLTRLYDPTSGTLLIDGIAAQRFRSSGLRQAMATFTQDHNLYPLSLYENIALGDPSRAMDSIAVNRAAKMGGAADFISKLVDGMDTILEPRNRAHGMNLVEDPEHPVTKKLSTLAKTIDISGGEKQRVVASRTFMHLSSGHVKFVAVDEPSSALDPEAEATLFDHLIAQRTGKTMVFVTHRFGHLTKHADTIICMKDGTVAESGNHKELMKLGGEYAKLYSIQANAFSSQTSS